ncbi:cell division protein ZapE [Celerinatantimonas diazotrophica]|uniref:Cell division protein ZapE n=1 Tax=Celerinatantimonas diazotrophica TaxID=412034 RepID=A0A4R1KIK5_9GAMM|nr:cell division protein ZapE [Celerinatantimonas diazotrophica]TCK63239.1 cell division protein ZapE [Celerinatantimonas diazotrophica]CAG9295608.1 Cell division protein ZapE [Celerinatantimonas diazotrophica]
MLSPKQRYKKDISEQKIVFDAAQMQVVDELERVHRAFSQPKPDSLVPKTRWWQRFTAKTTLNDPIRGVYLWGGVGRGKTYLMDLLVASLPASVVRRQHFYHFMQDIHQQLKIYQGQTDPLEKIAEQIAQQVRLICFDEFFVTDITDAMLLGTLFSALFRRGISLVATSNIVPDDLYHNGLQRSRFLPAIALIKRHCEVINLDGPTDYRQNVIQSGHCFYWPLSESATTSLNKMFEQLTHTLPNPQEIEVNHRKVACRGCYNGVLYSDFSRLCQSARSANDYIELAHRFHTVIIGDIPLLNDDQSDALRRFITLVDEFYERHVIIVASMQARPQDLYEGQRLAFEYQRCCSRLQQMDSQEYLDLEHLP